MIPRARFSQFMACLCSAGLAAAVPNFAFARSDKTNRKPAAVLDPVAAPPSAQNTAGLTLDDCYAAALKRSEVIGTQVELIVQAEETIKQAYGSILPGITGSASRTWQEPVNNGTGSSIFPSTQDLVKLTATQPLFRGLREFAGIRQAKGLDQATVEDKRAAEVQLYKDTSQAFFNVLFFERDLANINTELELYRKRVTELNERIRIGRSRVSEVLTIESSAASLRAQADAQRGQIDAAREILAFQTGLSRDIALRDNGAPGNGTMPIDKYLVRLEERPDVRGPKARVTAAEDAVSVAKGAHLPSVDLLGDYYITRPGLQADSKWDVQLLLTVPIYAGGTIESKVRQAASQGAQAELALSRARRLAEQDIRTTFETVQSDLIQIRSLESAVKLSERNYAEESREYRLGLVTNIDVLQALTSSQESVRALDRARYTLKNDLEKLEASAAMKPAQLSPPKM